MRLFVAIAPDEDARLALEAAQAEIRSKTRLRARWVPPGNLHVTLAFLGRVEAAIVADLRSALADALSPLAPFCVGLGRPGAFPSARRPRVLWVGIGDGAERVVDLAATVCGALAPFPVAVDERPFHPHVTIGRVGVPAVDAALAARIESWARPIGAPWKVRTVTLFESLPGPGSPRYEPVAVLPLAGAGPAAR